MIDASHTWLYEVTLSGVLTLGSFDKGGCPEVCTSSAPTRCCRCCTRLSSSCKLVTGAFELSGMDLVELSPPGGGCIGAGNCGAKQEPAGETLETAPASSSRQATCCVIMLPLIRVQSGTGVRRLSSLQRIFQEMNV
jgi:hypothetical protein